MATKIRLISTTIDELETTIEALKEFRRVMEGKAEKAPDWATSDARRREAAIMAEACYLVEQELHVRYTEGN